MTGGCAGCRAEPWADVLWLPEPGSGMAGERCRPPRESPAALPVPSGADARTRRRWILGHQVAFMVWRLTADALIPLTAPTSAHGPSAVEEAARLYDLSSALFVYTGSCSAERYEATVRADMRNCDPAFSGEWAADHAPLPGLLARVRSAHPPRVLGRLMDAVHTGHRVHRAMAERLVPHGASLLRTAGRPSGRGPTPDEISRYDAFFRVERGPVCRSGFAVQLLRRTEWMLADLATHGLDGGGPQLPLDEATVVGHLEELAHSLTTTIAREESPVPL
ncbi:hypothetical protein ABZT04_10800 [Streptomyces sp. NPDC005492]|uniref:hypothetical protein n=1 Tax=Streptomyces sp. NPDC005492 TaxID=3156883 RepID=UPI0033BBD6CD